ncbi:von Willebrand factor [Labeo rohita]|uniref:von Willebrand factor n=1 Tax=Labeo rohita TaxID=84645 RepID=A0ABQ8LUR5_LABRO|nr:von Willebrand factor [Labeo rohita]
MNASLLQWFNRPAGSVCVCVCVCELRGAPPSQQSVLLTHTILNERVKIRPCPGVSRVRLCVTLRACRERAHEKLTTDTNSLPHSFYQRSTLQPFARLILQFLQCPDFLLLSSLNEYENGSHTIPPFLVLIKRFFPSKLGSSHVFRIVRHWTEKTKALQRTCRCEPAAEQRSDVKGNRCHIMELCRWKGWSRILWVFILNFSGFVSVEGSGRCSLFSRQHIQTFDGVIYEFPGDCSYMLAGDCQHRSFSILGDFSHGKRKGVTLFLGEFFELHLSVDGTLSQGAERLPLPYASSSVFAGYELGYIRLWSEEFGFSIRIDSSRNIQLTLAKQHSNRTCGLCGNYNYLVEDEYTAQEGFLTDDPYDFANSWAMKGADEPCKRVIPPSQSCNGTGESAKDQMSRCEAMRSSTLYLRCAHLVDPAAFVSVCESDACHCSTGDDCVCQAMLEYARTCASRGITLSNWHIQSQCSPKCPIGMEYSDCTPTCSTSCQNVNIQEVCKEECVDGCWMEIAVLTSLSAPAHMLDAATLLLPPYRRTATHGECLVTGQSHYKTFDNKFFTFSGICQYLLAKDCQSNSFSVIIETAQCADDQDAVCTRSITLRFHDLANQTVRLKHGGVVSVEGMDVQTPLINGALRVHNTVLSSVRLRYGDDLHLDWDGRGRVLLRLNPAYAGKTCGLCGNYNGNQGDDFLTVGGLVETRVEGFGNAWKMNADCDNVQLQPSDPCILNPKRVRFAEEACAVLLSTKFEPCHFVVNPEPYVKNCRFDVCSCADGQECLCEAVRSYAAACAAKGVLMYEVCGTVCNQTCRSLSLPDGDCVGFCEEGCFCPRGLFLSDSGECVPPEHCSCHRNGEIFEPNDMIGDHHSICVCERGSMQCTSNEATGSTLSDLFFDEHSSSRGRRSISCPPPLQRFECENARDVGIECAKTCQNLDLECVSQGCVSGCMCPPGTIRHKKECIPQDQCPCYHNNRPYASGQSINVDCNTCVCEKRQWKCTQRVCDGVCRVIGETHYISFDGLKFSFPGPCQYVLAQDYCNGLEGTFRVLVENSACGIAGYRCSKSITVLYMGGLIVMEHNEVRMKRPVLKEIGVEIVRSGQYYIILLVCGLCGNFDGNQNNDLLSSSNQMEVDAADFGNSWKVRPSCADAVPVVSQCSTDMVKLVTVEQSCRVLTSTIFRECNSVVDPEPYWDICTHDTCSCPSVGDCACFCNTIAAYAHECAQKGLVVNWRSNDLCPLSCEELNKDAGVECEWKYNACGSACPPTCQHPEPLNCPVTCVEGCHAVCPPGQVLDEVLRKCVEPSQCQVCVHNGERISHGKQFILNHDDPRLHCESNTLTCGPCPATGFATTLAPTTVDNTPTPLPFSTPVPADACDRAMDLAFLVDGSSALSEEDFNLVKLFILRVVERFRMGSAHTRATVLLFHSGVKSYDMQVQKWIFKKMVRELRYSGGDVAFMDEAIKYLAVYIYDKNKREHAGRVAILLTASANPRPMRSTQRLLRKKDITILTVALGPDVNMAQVNEITKATPSSRSYVVSSVTELDDEALAITEYLCTLGKDPEPPKKPSTAKPSTTSVTLTTTATSKLTAATIPPTAAIANTFPSIPSPGTTLPPPSVTTYELVFLLESSDAVGEEGFNKTRDALVDVIASLDENETENFRITVMQYSFTVTVVISRMELQRREQVLQRMRQLRWTKGAEVNTGHAIRSIYETVTTDTPSNTPGQMVFLITQSPPTDVIQRPPSSARKKVYPIGIGQKIHYEDLAQLSFPDEPIMLDNPSDLRRLRPMLINISKTIRRPVLPTLPPRATLPPSVPCSKPMDVLFLLRASSDNQFEDLKTFVRTFIKSTNIGRNDTQVAVIVYGAKSAVAVTWRDEQTKDNLFKLLETLHSKSDNTPRLGAALRLAVQTAVSSTSGGRMGIPKAVVMVVTDRSIDSPGETWLLSDGCHSVLCNPSGTVTVQSHRINCEKMEPPVCQSNLPALRYNHTCGCTWICPCSCMGSSTSHVVSFSGAALKLRAACSYVLLRTGGAELVLHTAACQSSPNQICMKSLEMREGGTSVVLRDDMKVTVDGVITAVPFRSEGVTVTQIGAILHQLRSEQHGFTLTFTPHSNDVTTDPDVYLKGWALGECVQHQVVESCAAGVAKGCDVLSSEVFSRCHALDYVQICRTVACQPNAVCDLVTAYSSVCRQQGVCVDWRTPTLCRESSTQWNMLPCRTGCLEQCGRSQFSRGDMMGDGLMKGNGSVCLNTPTEGCFCPEGSVLMGDKCQRINCTALPCTNAKAPECGQCEVLREKTGSKCCPEYECVCKKDQCPVTTKPSCPAYKKLSVIPSECCDSYECVCDCQNITRTCPPGYITKTTTNDCDCIEVTCTPDKVGTLLCSRCVCVIHLPLKLHVRMSVLCNQHVIDYLYVQVCVVDAVVYQVGSRWDEKCKTCTCTEQADRQTGLHIAQCVDPVGEQWVSPHDRCVWSECVQVNEEVFIQHINVSCHLMDTPTCPLGTELHSNGCLCDESNCYCGWRASNAGCVHTLRANTTRTDGCTKHTCSVNKDGELVLETLVTTCPPFDHKRCLEHGGKISQIGVTCCEMCTEPECSRTVGLLDYIRVDDCQSEEKIELTYCEGKCDSKSMYSLDKHKVESECVCCSATGTVPMNVPLRCANGTQTHHQVLAVTGCDCMSHACPTD